MRSIILYLVLITYLSIINSISGHAIRRIRSATDEDDDEPYENDDYEELESNSTGKGMYVGASCEINCNPKLLHVFCNPISKVCECENKYPVKLNPFKGCDKPTKLGEQCYYRESCVYADPHSSCIQVHHNAVCQCESGYHSVSIQKPSRRHFCAENVEEVTTEFSTLFGVITGIAVLSGLICFTLRLFNQNMYTGRHRYGNANLAPPILFSSDGGSRRPSITSIHSGSSIRSYSARRYERERQQKEEREMQKRLAKMHASTIVSNSSTRVPPTPSPHSASDEPYPIIEEIKRVPLAIQEESSSSFQDELPSTSKQYP